MIDKFSYHLPLERICRQFQEQGLKIDKKTLFSQTEAVYLNLLPILEKMKKEILNYGYVHVDETRGKILSNSTNGFIWSMGNKYGATFNSRRRDLEKLPKKCLVTLKGQSLMMVLAATTGLVRSGKKIKVANCWSHARRKFFDCLSNYPKAENVIELIDELFEVEHQSKGSFKRLGNLRKRKSKAITDERYEVLLKLERETLRKEF